MKTVLGFRMYPVPFRRLEEAQQYAKYDWVECDLVRNASDPRPESFRPTNAAELIPAGHIGTDRQWQERRKLLLKNGTVFTNLDELINGAKNNKLSLAVFKPSKILGFKWEAEDRTWDEQKLKQMQSTYRQLDLFEDNEWRRTFRVIPKLPYSFSYRFEDSTGRQSEMQVLDWETGALFWNCLRSTHGDEAKELAKVHQKYFGEFLTKDLHFFLGTTQQFHFVAPNPWVIIGPLPIPLETQESLF